jgi:glycine/D-amino acid oxidase-like deaminating enzyme
MPSARAQVVIIGAGVMGASIAYHLAMRGCTDILILEKEPTEISGTPARSVAGVRHQFSAAVNVKLSLYSIERIKHFTEETGGHADLKQVGYLFLIDDPATWEHYQRSAAMQRGLGARRDADACGGHALCSADPYRRPARRDLWARRRPLRRAWHRALAGHRHADRRGDP